MGSENRFNQIIYQNYRKMTINFKPLAILFAVAIATVLSTGCKKEKMTDVKPSMINDETLYGKGDRLRENVVVVFRGEKRQVTHQIGETTIVEIICEPPYDRECMCLSVPEETLKKGKTSDMNGSVIIFGDEDSSDVIPLNVEIPIHQCTIDKTNNKVEFVLD